MHIILQTTIDTRENAAQLARTLVEQRLAACVHILPVASIYRWEGAIEEASEYVLQAKTVQRLATAAMDGVRAAHPYDEPEIIVTEITTGSASYLDWIEAETLADPPPAAPKE